MSNFKVQVFGKLLIKIQGGGGGGGFRLTENYQFTLTNVIKGT